MRWIFEARHDLLRPIHARRFFPVLAKQCGAFLAIVNRDPTPLDPLADFSFRDAIGEFFLKLQPLLTNG